MPSRRWTPDPPIDMAACVARYLRWGADPVNTVTDGVYYRVISVGGRPLPYSARQFATGDIEVTVDAGKAVEPALVDFKHRMAHALPAAPLRRLAERDPIIGAALAARPGYRPPMTGDLFESLVTAVTAQQVNLRWATTTRSRLVAKYGKRRRFSGRMLWQFPTPRALADAAPRDIRALQFTNAKAAYTIEIAEAAVAGHLSNIGALGNEAAVATLTKIKGVGRWTAEWALARCLARPDVVAAGDLGVRKAIGGAYLGRIADEDEVRQISAPWGDAANWATHLLLEGLSG